MDKEQREFRVDPLKLKRLRVQFGLTIEKFWKKAHLDKGTAQKLFRGGPVSLATLSEAAKVFGISNHLELLHPDELVALGVEPEESGSNQVLEWDVESRLSGWERTPNGLQYQLARLRHRFLKDRQARGKCYELRHLTAADRKRLEEHLRRHPEVCERIGKHPNIAENLTATFVEQGGLWWVLDRWEEGTTLEERLREQPLSGTDLKQVSLGIAEGLHALHRAKIVRRELSPAFVILRKKDLSPVLTDFELAKLLEGRPTVAPTGGWPENPYRALEVTGEGTVDERADVYSWGRVFVAAALAALPERGGEVSALSRCNLPASVRDVVAGCVHKARSDRPGDMTDVLKILKRWRA